MVFLFNRAPYTWYAEFIFKLSLFSSQYHIVFLKDSIICSRYIILYSSVVLIVASYRKLVAVAKSRRQSIETFHCRLSELRYSSKCFRNIWFICGWLGSSKRSNSILHLFSTYFKFNSYKIEAKNALNLAKPHDFSRDGRSHIVVDRLPNSSILIGQFRLRNIG